MTKTKKEKTVDLSRPEKVKEDQLKKIQSIVDRIYSRNRRLNKNN